jgi:hypothetical protein
VNKPLAGVSVALCSAITFFLESDVDKDKHVWLLNALHTTLYIALVLAPERSAHSLGIGS